MKNHYYKTPVTKMGQWNTPPLDTDTWMGVETKNFYKKVFGIPKGLLTLHTSATGYMHAYVPVNYFKLLHARIESINKKDYRNLEKKLEVFYKIYSDAKIKVAQVYKNPKKLSNKNLAKAIQTIRHYIHQVVVYDQFAWLAEEYWTPRLRSILEKDLGLRHGTKEYNEALFALSKPEYLSTTLAEKKAVFELVIKIKTKRVATSNASAILSKKYGWMPIFCYGDEWGPEHYALELKNTLGKKLSELKTEYNLLKNYRVIRRNDIAAINKKYLLPEKHLQEFIDFGLAIDTRNEAEYFVSYAGRFLMPLFNEARMRLFLSPKQLRELTEKELLRSLQVHGLAEKLMAQKGSYGGWGYDEKMEKRIDFSSKEAEKLFAFVESYVKPLQGGNENKGTCASPGKVTGKIKIVPYPDQNNKVENGDILVTYATTVDYLPAMKRAAAIITEVGGLTCHAAVVSREFGIPCIVALTNAMKNFKDGELVEVDADNGVVKKL